MNRILAAVLVVALAALARGDEVETIVCFRHGEKTPTELGQLSVAGLNRSLALPGVLIPKYGKPQFLFAPDPAKDLVGGRDGAPRRYYLRPLATIEPTAIKLGMPVNTAFGLRDVAGLERELLRPDYAHALIFVSWEHHALADFLAKITSDIQKTPLQPVDWPSADFDSIYVIRIRHGAGGGDTLTVDHDHEGLGRPSDTFPAPAPSRP